MNEEETKVIAKLITDVGYLQGHLSVTDMMVKAMTRMMSVEFCVTMRDMLAAGLARSDEEISGPPLVETAIPNIYPKCWREAARQRISDLDEIIAKHP